MYPYSDSEIFGAQGSDIARLQRELEALTQRVTRLEQQSAPAAPQAEEPMWKRLRDAGFTKRDNRITCDECGKRFTPQFLPIHKCEPIDPHMIAAEDRFPDAPQAEPTNQQAWIDSPANAVVSGRDDAQQGPGVVPGTPSISQAEPKRELTAAERDVMDSALRSSVKLVARGVAEPKREPATDAILAACNGTRERAAKACEALAFPEANSHWSDGFNTAIKRCAAAIRALGRQHD